MTSTSAPELTELQQRFVENLLECPSATEAYRRAGGRATSDKSAFQQASRLMGNSEVQAALRLYKAARAELVIVDAAWVRERLVLLIERSMQAVPVYDSEGKETGVWKADNNAANTALWTLAMMQIKEEVEKRNENSTRTPEEVKANLIAKLGLGSDHFDEPSDEDIAEIKRLGLRNYDELRALRKGQTIREQLKKRGIDPDTTPVQSPHGSASTLRVRAAAATAPNESRTGLGSP